METNLLLLWAGLAVAAITIGILVAVSFKANKQNAELERAVNFWKNEYSALSAGFIGLTVKKPERPPKFSDKKYFGACWMSFQNEARNAGAIKENGGTIEITVLVKK